MNNYLNFENIKAMKSNPLYASRDVYEGIAETYFILTITEVEKLDKIREVLKNKVLLEIKNLTSV